MKQIVQNYNDGNLWLEDIPVPICRSGHVLVRNEFSVVSAGTERMKVSQARMSLMEKARERPDQVRQVLQSMQQMGLKETYDKVQERLNSLSPLGYSSAGTIVEVGEPIDSLIAGQRVACAGEGIACHAEYVAVPRNLCAAIPDAVSSSDASFATVGAIALNGVRQASVSLGDTVLVVGLGLVGLLGVQLLNAAGCRVIGVDLDRDKLDLALASGAEAVFLNDDPDIVEQVSTLTGGKGVDVAYVAASTNSNGPMTLAGDTLRDRGTVVVVGMVPVEADWRIYYGKELNIVMARSYGPGRYDRNYENKGIDYPVGYVPWTERRNLEEFLRLIERGVVSPSALKPRIVPFEDAPSVYSDLHEHKESSLAIVFRYPEQTAAIPTRKIQVAAGIRRDSTPVKIAMLGAGNFATGTLIPALKKIDDVALHTICSAGGLTAKSAANRHGFINASSDVDNVFSDPDINAVVIATRHDTHAEFAMRALEAGKHVFVEKPLALDGDELKALFEVRRKADRILMPGFNRRFSNLSRAVRDFFSESGGPLEIVCRVNAGKIESDSWYQDQSEGGWRIVSEGCHFVDLISFLSRGIPQDVFARMIQGDTEGLQNDCCHASIRLDNGSIATLHYYSNGDMAVGKERIEVFGQQRSAVIDNWRNARLYQDGGSRKVARDSSGKGHLAELRAFADAISKGGPDPIDAESGYATSLATLMIQKSIRSGTVERLSVDD